MVNIFWQRLAAKDLPKQPQRHLLRVGFIVQIVIKQQNNK